MTLENSLSPCKTKNELQQAANMLQEAFLQAGKFDHSTPPCTELQRIGVIVQDTDFNISKIMSGKDLDINLDIPFILESFSKNGK